MGIFEFMAGSPFLSFFLIWTIVWGFTTLVNRVMRHWNIHKHGYPPPHCDADGDFKKKEEE